MSTYNAFHASCTVAVISGDGGGSGRGENGASSRGSWWWLTGVRGGVADTCFIGGTHLTYAVVCA